MQINESRYCISSTIIKHMPYDFHRICYPHNSQIWYEFYCYLMHALSSNSYCTFEGDAAAKLSCLTSSQQCIDSFSYLSVSCLTAMLVWQVQDYPIPSKLSCHMLLLSLCLSGRAGPFPIKGNTLLTIKGNNALGHQNNPQPPTVC